MGLGVWATNEYQTSLLVPQALVVAANDVAEFKIPDVLLQEVLLFKAIAPVQRSLAGGSVTQILNIPLTLGSVYTRMK
jgi:NADPH-dependent 2,4-dienoyl-CoA reductase/sulfur reductase-like enzyme